MNQRAIPINAVVMSLMFAYLLFGFLAAGIASAAMVDHKSGSWVNKDYKIKGEWSIVQRGEQQVISFNQKFKTKKGPDLKVFLSKQPIASLNGKNAIDDAVLVSVLRSNKGAQEYVLPAGVDVSDFTSLIIHCEAYSVLWGGTDI